MRASSSYEISEIGCHISLSNKMLIESRKTGQEQNIGFQNNITSMDLIFWIIASLRLNFLESFSVVGSRRSYCNLDLRGCTPSRFAIVLVGDGSRLGVRDIYIPSKDLADEPSLLIWSSRFTGVLLLHGGQLTTLSTSPESRIKVAEVRM